MISSHMFITRCHISARKTRLWPFSINVKMVTSWPLNKNTICSWLRSSHRLSLCNKRLYNAISLSAVGHLCTTHQFSSISSTAYKSFQLLFWAEWRCCFPCHSHPVSVFQFVSLFSVSGSRRKVSWGRFICLPNWCLLLQPPVDRWLEQLTSQVIARVSFCFQKRDQFPTKQGSILTKAFVKKYKKFTLQGVQDHFSNLGGNCFSFILIFLYFDLYTDLQVLAFNNPCYMRF